MGVDPSGGVGLWIGLYPKFFLDKMNPSVDAFISDFNIRYKQSHGISKPQIADLQAVDSEELGTYALAQHTEEGR